MIQVPDKLIQPLKSIYEEFTVIWVNAFLLCEVSDYELIQTMCDNNFFFKTGIPKEIKSTREKTKYIAYDFKYIMCMYVCTYKYHVRVYAHTYQKYNLP